MAAPDSNVDVHLTRETFNLAGLLVHVWSNGGIQALSTKELAAMILMHGWKESTDDPALERTARAAFQWALARQQPVPVSALQHDFLVVMFCKDDRTCGTTGIGRSTRAQTNDGAIILSTITQHTRFGNADRWSMERRIDIFGMLVGSARDVSFVIDFLPLYLFPHGERTIVEWAVAGTSLGAQAVWLVLKEEPRVRTGIAVIGSPNCIAVMRAMGAATGVPIAPPYVPDALLALMRRLDPTSAAADCTAYNPYFGKQVLVVAAEQDVYMAWGAYAAFVEEMEVGPGGRKEVLRLPGGHCYTEEMMWALVRFFWEECVVGRRPGKAKL
ncbi:hypothetical protein EVG20_g976 [Dentipellis fragilis]|uniref:Uncharacterized protein n=1 Tax=Dentipellis fragilis TaxID=205917 RepID=A0A4Y9ZB76_9AGAM|nr:hypothetical protein EVG20_g976 [Dentipellis fragilis]